MRTIFNYRRMRFLYFYLTVISVFLLGTPAEGGKGEDPKLEPSSEAPISKSVAPPPQASPLPSDREEGVPVAPKPACAGDKSPSKGSYHFTHDLEEKEDRFDFLVTRYPQSVDRGDVSYDTASQDMRRTFEQVQHDEGLAGVYMNAALEIFHMKVLSPELYFQDIRREYPTLSLIVQLNVIAPQVVFKTKTRLEKIHKLHCEFLKSQASEFARYQLALVNVRPIDRTVAEDLLLAASSIRARVMHMPGNCLYLGRSPYLLSLVHALLDETYGNLSLSMQVNFSGSPDMLSRRPDSTYAHPEAYARDIVTPRRLNAFFDYMDSKNLHSWTGTTYIVDVIGTGSSLVGFVRVWEAYFKHHGKEIPPLHFLFLYSCDPIEDLDLEFWHYSHRTGRFVVKEDKSKGIRGLDIPPNPVSCYDATRNRVLDDDNFQALFSQGTKFTACEWERKDPKTTGVLHKMIQPHLENLFKALIKKKHKKLDPLFKAQTIPHNP